MKEVKMKAIKKEDLDVGMYFTIQYYAKKHDFQRITRKARWTEDCYFGNRKTDGVPYVRYFDVMQDGIRCATNEYKPFEISEIRENK